MVETDLLGYMVGTYFEFPWYTLWCIIGGIFVGYLGAWIWHMDGIHIGTCSWWVDDVIMLYTIDES
jgi:hypothetical protein